MINLRLSLYPRSSLSSPFTPAPPLAPPLLLLVAVGVEALAPTVVSLIDGGIRRLLVEKPGAIDSTSLAQVAMAAVRCSAEVVIGYNRRYYAATTAARSMI